MTPEAILLTIQSLANLGIEALKFAQTEEGRKLIEKSLADRLAWDKFWSDAGHGISRLFKGDLFK